MQGIRERVRSRWGAKRGEREGEGADGEGKGGERGEGGERGTGCRKY